MYIATQYFETRFKQIFKKGDTVPEEIAKLFPKKVQEAELLIDESSDIEVDTKKIDIYDINDSDLDVINLDEIAINEEETEKPKRKKKITKVTDKKSE